MQQIFEELDNILAAVNQLAEVIQAADAMQTYIEERNNLLGVRCCANDLQIAHESADYFNRDIDCKSQFFYSACLVHASFPNLS